jgi:hypothetical protein
MSSMGKKRFGRPAARALGRRRSVSSVTSSVTPTLRRASRSASKSSISPGRGVPARRPRFIQRKPRGPMAWRVGAIACGGTGVGSTPSARCSAGVPGLGTLQLPVRRNCRPASVDGPAKKSAAGRASSTWPPASSATTSPTARACRMLCVTSSTARRSPSRRSSDHRVSRNRGAWARQRAGGAAPRPWSSRREPPLGQAGGRHAPRAPESASRSSRASLRAISICCARSRDDGSAATRPGSRTPCRSEPRVLREQRGHRRPRPARLRHRPAPGAQPGVRIAALRSNMDLPTPAGPMDRHAALRHVRSAAPAPRS